MYYIILGLIQGLTEFLPVSSSGHLVISQKLLNIEISDVAFEVFLHLGTSLAVIFLFKKEIKKILLSFLKSLTKLFQWKLFLNYLKEDNQGKFAWLLLLSTIPGALIGYFFQNIIEQMFSSSTFTASMLMITGLCLFLTDKYFITGNKTIKDTNWVDALFIGFAQALAIIPGLSRSGFTIMMALSRRFDREYAATYSFILSIPIILGTSIYKFKDISNININISLLFLSGLTAFLSGYLAMIVLKKLLLNFKLHLFSYYLWAVGFLILFLVP